MERRLDASVTDPRSTPTWRASARLILALGKAAEWHRGQTRKGTATPYLGHLLEVAGIAIEHGATEDETIAALLHDAAEDQGGRARLDEIRELFGSEVARIVEGCSDAFGAPGVPKPPWEQRKRAYLQRLPHEPPSVLLISAADKLQNARAILRDYRVVGERLWERFTGGKAGTLWYHRALVGTYAKSGAPPVSRPPGGASPTPAREDRSRSVASFDDLVAQLDRVVSELERLAGSEPGHDAAPESELEEKPVSQGYLRQDSGLEEEATSQTQPRRDTGSELELAERTEDLDATVRTPDLQVAGRWVLASDETRALTTELGAPGSLLLGYAYIDHHAGLTLDVAFCCSVGRESTIDVKVDLAERGESWKLRFGSFRVVRPLSKQERRQLSLPGRPDWLTVYAVPQVEPLRGMATLDPLRAPGFPDDIRLLLPEIEGRAEGVWGRMERLLPDGRIECVLLNEPFRDYGLHAGDRIVIEVVAVNGGALAWFSERPG